MARRKMADERNDSLEVEKIVQRLRGCASPGGSARRRGGAAARRGELRGTAAENLGRGALASVMLSVELMPTIMSSGTSKKSGPAARSSVEAYEAM